MYSRQIIKIYVVFLKLVWMDREEQARIGEELIIYLEI